MRRSGRRRSGGSSGKSRRLGGVGTLIMMIYAIKRNQQGQRQRQRRSQWQGQWQGLGGIPE
jgi:hypothetical protein